MMKGPHKTRNRRLPARAWPGVLAVLLGGALLAWLFLLPGGDNALSPESPGAGAQTQNASEPGFDQVENGIHLRTGFVEGEGLMTVVTHCTACHSAKLVTQNRMTREGWEQTIRWMQKTQNLWDLGENEQIILDYLAAHYAPEKKGRRQNLADIEWYELKP